MGSTTPDFAKLSLSNLNTPLQICHLVIQEVRITSKCYSNDIHNQQQHDDLKLEHFMKVMKWDTCVNHYIVGMIVIDG